MGNEIKDGGPAFPNEGFNGWGTPQKGMTLRDYFATHAPVTCIDANQSLLQQPDAARFASCDHDGAMPMPLIMKELVRLRWEYADAMLAAREGEA
ncbi:hypothetical protein D3C87_1867900 [compost metagenome]